MSDNEILDIALGRKTARRRKSFPEQDAQIALLELLIGPSGKGPRVPGAGLTGKWPELGLIYAVPNGYAKSPGAAGRAKAEGLLADVPDLVLPVARVPFYGLYLEGKVEGKSPGPGQCAYIAALVEQGYAALVFRGVQQGLDIVLRYLALPTFADPYCGTTRVADVRAAALSRLQQPIMASDRVR